MAGIVDGVGTSARFNDPTGVATDAAGNVYVADRANQRIRKITPGSTVSTLAGNGTIGFVNGLGTSASFNDPTGVATDAAGNVYVADTSNHLIRRITPGSAVTTFAGMAGVAGSTDGTGTAASFNDPTGVATDAARNVYVGDQLNHLIRKIGNCEVSQPVPTLSQWGLIILGLFLTTFSVVAIKSKLEEDHDLLASGNAR